MFIEIEQIDDILPQLLVVSVDIVRVKTKILSFPRYQHYILLTTFTNTRIFHFKLIINTELLML